MNSHHLIKQTPWDSAAYEMPTWEVQEYSIMALDVATTTRGHHTIKVDPLADKTLLFRYGFYYCDTLIEPICDAARLRTSEDPNATISHEIDYQHALEICHGAFSHGRFHRDFNLSKDASDLRYDNWLKQLLSNHQVFGLYWQKELAGFIGYNENNLVLHALAQKFRGLGLSKYWWSAVCRELLKKDYTTINSSISVSNLSVLNLYVSLGFSFSNPKDIYHCLIQN